VAVVVVAAAVAAVVEEGVVGMGVLIIRVLLHRHRLMQKKIQGQLLGRGLAIMIWTWLLR
jgi:hypothetical protein